jgi:hypothetical protein
MANTSFTPESLMTYLINKYAYLNDNNVKAQEVYNKIISKQSN